MDVESAFINEYLEEEVCMWQPQGFEQKGKEQLLKKALYGSNMLLELGHLSEWT